MADLPGRSSSRCSICLLDLSSFFFRTKTSAPEKGSLFCNIFIRVEEMMNPPLPTIYFLCLLTIYARPASVKWIQQQSEQVPLIRTTWPPTSHEGMSMMDSTFLFLWKSIKREREKEKRFHLMMGSKKQHSHGSSKTKDLVVSVYSSFQWDAWRTVSCSSFIHLLKEGCFVDITICWGFKQRT